MKQEDKGDWMKFGYFVLLSVAVGLIQYLAS